MSSIFAYVDGLSPGGFFLFTAIFAAIATMIAMALDKLSEHHEH